MTRTIFCAAAILCTVMAHAAEQPNFLLIVADDLGFSDLGCYGSEIATPHLDSLATNGIRFTQFYNTARCWPTRSALLTGYYPQQIRRDTMPGVDPRTFGNRGIRPDWAPLISSRLRDAGYRCYHSGKWHIDGKPTENGFHRSYHVRRALNFFRPAVHDRDDVELPRVEPGSDYYVTVATADHAIECLREHAGQYSDHPFFHYLAFHAPHFPLHALPEDIARYRDRYTAGWDQLRQERYARLRELGIVECPLSPLEPEIGPPYDFPDDIVLLGRGEINRPAPWGQLTAEQRRFQAAKMAIHAAMIDRMDREIGRVLAQLRAMRAFENTVVFFLSDNGASAEIMVRGDGHDPTAPLGSAETYLCLGPGFSSAANTPFRRHKTWVHEGGIATPFIVHWPQGISARNEMRTTVGHVIDVAPTILQLAGSGAPSSSGPPAPGRSLAAVFQRDAGPLHEQLWFYHEGNRALRQGDWKVVHANGTRPFPWTSSPAAAAEDPRQGNWALYDLATDRAEQHDLASRHPSRARDMAAQWGQLRDQFERDSQTP